MRRLSASAVIVVAALALDGSAAAQHRLRTSAPGAPTDDGTRAPSLETRDTLATRPAGAKHAIRLRGGDKHLIVHGTFNSTLSGPMLVDTGASYCVLSRAVARRLRLSPSASTAVPVSTANGQVLADLVELDSIQIEGARLPRVEAVVMDAVDPPLIGIIGLSFLNHFRYSVDHAEGTIQLER
jgi:clan AA aspartic protease (TIGR02281 family)